MSERGKLLAIVAWPPRDERGTHPSPGFSPFTEMKATHEEMRAARLPISYRDYCAHLLIPLNKCRKETFYLPFKCTDERHEYERCQYVE